MTDFRPSLAALLARAGLTQDLDFRPDLAEAVRQLSDAEAQALFAAKPGGLALLDYAAIVIEDTVPGFLIRPPHSKANPKSAICSLLAWSVRYRLPVFFAGDREHGNLPVPEL